MSEESWSCNICGEECYSYEFEDDECVYLKEWLTAESMCSKCEKKGCSSCIKTCYTCGNIGEDGYSVCQNCLEQSDLKSLCEYHTWYVCTKHKNEKCDECTANKNYDRYNW